MTEESGQFDLAGLFAELADLPPSERDAVLDEKCGNDAQLRARVIRLLAHDIPAADGFMSSRIDVSASAMPRGLSIGERVAGKYALLRVVGEGGMGTVFEAQQDHPNRRVALKIMRPDWISSHLAPRFRREVQMLGRLHHPGIAHIYEAGSIDLAGLEHPYFAMEFINGLPLTEHADRHKLRPRERLTLVAEICDAVQHAHDQGVIHRDLKPANILVDEAGRPRVLDFGVARAADNELMHTLTMQTGVGQLIGTLPYMSPEQAGGDPSQIDARSDVYALGVILFELLAGRLPLDVRGKSTAEAARVIRDEDPSRLSRIDSSFRGDIDTIVAKAMEKDKTRRYASAGDLAADIRRHLRDEPIVARPTSTLYQLRKFTKRNKALVGGVCGVIIVSAVSAVVATLLALSESKQRQLAQRVAYRASITAAESALQTFDVSTARKSLESAPQDLRGWEWRHYSSRLDDSLACVRLPDSEHIHLGSHPRLTPDTTIWTLLARTPELRLSEGDITSLATQPPQGAGWHLAYIEPSGQLEIWAQQETNPVAMLIRDRVKITERLIDTTLDGATWPSSIRISPDREWMAFTSFKPDTIHAVHLSTKQRRSRPVVSDGRGICVEWSPVGQTLASTAGPQGAACLWRMDTDTILALPESTATNSVAFNDTGSLIATASADGGVRMYRTDSAQLVAASRGHTNEATDVAFHPNGDVIASAGLDRTLRLWDASTLDPLAVMIGHEAGLRSVVYSPNGSRLLTVSTDYSLRVWDGATRTTSGILRGHSSYVYPVCFSPDGSVLASAGWDGTIRLWNSEDEKPLRSWHANQGNIYRLVFSPDGSRLVSWGDQGSIVLSETGSGTPVATVGSRFLAESVRVAPLLAAHPDGVHVFAGHDTTGKFAIFADIRGHEPVKLPWNVLSETCPSLLSADGGWLTTLEAGPSWATLKVFDPHTGSLRFESSIGQSGNFAMSPRALERVLITFPGAGGEAKSVFVHDLMTGRQIAKLDHTDEVFAVAWLPDGSRLATAGRDQVVRLWNTTTWEEVGQLTGHRSYIWSLAFSPDGRTLASGSGDGTIRLWKAR